MKCYVFIEACIAYGHVRTVREGALSLSAFELLSVELPVSIWQAVSVLLKFDVDATPFPFFCVVPVHVFFHLDSMKSELNGAIC